MIDITTQVLDANELSHVESLGWYFDFDSSGTNDEKVLSGARTIAGAVLFTTYEPEGGSADPCAANIGGGSAYNFNILNTKGFLDWDADGNPNEDFDDRKLTLGGGIPSDVVPVFTKEGVVGIVGVEGGAAQLGLLSGIPRVRTYWYEEI
jgi:type IV pilus assembly protein PilY1